MSMTRSGLLRDIEIRFMVLLATCTPTKFLKWLSRKMYSQSVNGRYIYRLSTHVAMKTNDWLRPAEAETMLFLAENTRIPVPPIYKAWTFSTGISAFLMQWFDDAFTLEERWPMLSESDKSVIAIQVRSIINELRNIPQPRVIHGQICQFDGSACWDERLKSQHCGPFSSEKSFNDFRLSLLDHFYWEPGARMQIDQLRSQLKSDHRIVLTHGDLAAKNILLDDNNTVIALLDWEMSGWRPEHWEYLKAIHGQWEQEDWLRIARQMVPVYDKEMEVDDQFILINGGAPF